MFYPKDFKRYYQWLKVHRVKAAVICAAAFFCILASIYGLYLKAPLSFQPETTLIIERNDSLSKVITKLDELGTLRSPFAFKVVARLFHDATKIVPGVYEFDEPISAWSIASIITDGGAVNRMVKVTVAEGLPVRTIATVLNNRLANFEAARFVSLALKYEGYLFPDTYHFDPVSTPEEVIKAMRRTFDVKIEPLRAQLKASPHTLRDIVIMASILEEEARTSESRRMIAGILWKRIEIGMPLQVDAVFPYINGKNTFELTLKDLTIDSPYNTYKYKGLPAGPITNPGLDSIEAALNPASSNYLYYLSDMEGNMHYAETFEKHVANKNKYLK